MKRILYLERNGTLKGGGQESLVQLVRELDRTRFQPLVVLGEDGPLKEALLASGAECRVLPMAPLGLATLPAAWAGLRSLADCARRNRADLLHANESRSHVYAGLLSRWIGLPSVFHYRVSYPDGIYDRLLPRLCDRIIAVSHAATARFRGFESRLRVVPNGVDLERFSVRPPKTSLPLRIGSVGRYGREKGFADLVRAFALVRPQFPESELILAGGGEEPDRLELEKLNHALKIEKSVLLPGRITDMAGFLATLDCFVLLSENEGLNRSILEAMASGLPVVATQVGGNPEVITHGANGLLVPWGQPEQAASAIRNVLGDVGLQKKLAQAGRKTVEEKFSIQRHARAVEAVYNELISG